MKGRVRHDETKQKTNNTTNSESKYDEYVQFIIIGITISMNRNVLFMQLV